MNIGVFLLIEPFASVERQLERAKEMGFDHADIPSSTLEIIGSEDILKKSVKYLKDNGL